MARACSDAEFVISKMPQEVLGHRSCEIRALLSNITVDRVVLRGELRRGGTVIFVGGPLVARVSGVEECDNLLDGARYVDLVRRSRNLDLRRHVDDRACHDLAIPVWGE